MNYSTSHSPSPPSPASIRRRELVNELSRGHSAAEILLRRFIRAPSSLPLAGTDNPASDSDLAEAIWNSFNVSLSIVKNCDSLLDSRFSEDCKIEDSSVGDGDESASRIKDRRGCYKRRKRGQSWTTEGEAPTEDGHQWRKYGQKTILNTQFPRNYYRCTHKTDQGCQAVKQVQKTSDDPPHYKTTYSGTHTCKNPHKTPQIIIPSPSPDHQSDSSFLLSFDRTSNNVNNPFVFPPSHSCEPVKQEQMATNTTNNAVASQAMMMMMMNPSSSSDYNYLSTPAGSDHGGDVISIGEYSCSASPHSLEIDNYMMLGQEPLDLIQFECDDI